MTRNDEVAELALAFAPVPRDSRQIINERKPPANQAVEQRRLADIGAADDGNGKGMRRASQ